MTNQEALRTAYSKRKDSAGEERDFLNTIIQALEQTRWIPVSEKKPKPKETENLIAKYYLIQNEYGDMMVARYDGIGWVQMYQHEYIEDEVVAWMPLPQPYEPQESEDEE